MVTIIPTPKENVIVFDVSGAITKKDYEETLIPELDKLIAKYGKVNVVCILNSELKDFTLGAFWDDLLYGIKHLGSVHRMALLTNKQALKSILELYDKVAPGDYKAFDKDQLDEAIAWATAE